MKIFNLVMVLLCVTFFSANAAAAVFIKFEGVEGESQDAQHDKWIDVLSVDWGMNKPQNATGQSRRRGSVKVEDIQVSFDFNLASPVLMGALARGEVLRSATIEFVENDGDGASTTYLTYQLTNVQMTGYQTSFAGKGYPIEQYSFSFEEIEVDYESSGEQTSMFRWRVEQGR